MLEYLKKLSEKRKRDLEAWQNLDSMVCLHCGTVHKDVQEIKIRGRLSLGDKWFDLHHLGIPGFGTLMCVNCVKKLQERLNSL